MIFAERWLTTVAQVLNVSVDELLGKSSNSKSGLYLEAEEAVNAMRHFEGKPISESQREVLLDIVTAYLKSKDK